MMEENWKRVEADFRLLKMTTTYPGDNTKFWYIFSVLKMSKKPRQLSCEKD